MFWKIIIILTHNSNYLIHLHSLSPKTVLVNGDHPRVLQYGLLGGADSAQVGWHEQRGCHDGPHAKLSILLVVTQTKVTNQELQVDRAFLKLEYRG